MTPKQYEGELAFEEKALKKPSDILIPSYQLINEKLKTNADYVRGLIARNVFLKDGVEESAEPEA